MKIYAIKNIYLQEYYSIKQREKTKVVYFSKYRDAIKFSKFLSGSDKKKSKVPELHEYKTYNKQLLNITKYHIEQLDKTPFDYRLGLNHLGYHEVEIVDDILVCRDSGYVQTTQKAKIRSFNEIFDKN